MITVDPLGRQEVFQSDLGMSFSDYHESSKEEGMKRIVKRKTRNIFFLLLGLGLLAIVAGPAPGYASLSVSSVASLDWSLVSFSRADLNWFDMTAVPPLDTRGSLSSVSTTLGGLTDPYNSSFIDGAPWGTTTATWSPIANAVTTVTGHGETSTSLLLASAQIQSTVPIWASVDLAQAMFSGQFSVLTAGLLTVSVPYALSETITNDIAAIDILTALIVGLTLSDFNTTDPVTGQSLILASSSDSYSAAILGAGSDLFSRAGTLTLSLNLVPGMIYDFEAFAGTMASVPEPGTLLLLSCGLIGLGVFRRRLV
jgi:hypothetical protein